MKVHSTTDEYTACLWMNGYGCTLWALELAGPQLYSWRSSVLKGLETETMRTIWTCSEIDKQKPKFILWETSYLMRDHRLKVNMDLVNECPIQ